MNTPSDTPTTDTAAEAPLDEEFAVRRVEREVNAQLGGAATIRDIVRLMLEMGWMAPA